MTVVAQLDADPSTRSVWVHELLSYRRVVLEMARADFKVRYKRATFGIAWAVVVPLVQATVLAVVFSRALKLAGHNLVNYPVYVLGGVLVWSYFSQTVTPGSTAIVDGSALTDKLWFPRALLPIVPAIANLVGLAASMVALVVLMVPFGVIPGPTVLLLVPACVLLVAFTTGLSLVLSALHVYFRDVRYLLQAALLVWFYATPVIYFGTTLGNFRYLLDANPMTGILIPFRAATGGLPDHWHRAVFVSIVATIALFVAAIEIYRRHDRLFADLL